MMKSYYSQYILIVLAVLIVPFQGYSKINEFGLLEKAEDYTAYGFLYDEANLLNDDENEQISNILSEYNSKGTGRIAVIILKELPGKISIERCAYDLINAIPSFETEKKNRILLLVAVKNRKIRIETSKDIWESLTDNECGYIIKNVIAPEFKKERYYSGLKAGLSAITAKLNN